MPLATKRQEFRDEPSAADAGTGQSAPVSRQWANAHATLLQRGYVRFHPVLAEITGGFKPALMLGHALYWTRTWLQQHPQRDGWFWKTSAEWRDATALSPREQEGARARLRTSGVWQERLAGSPARMNFKVDLPGLSDQLASLASTTAVFPAFSLGSAHNFARPADHLLSTARRHRGRTVRGLGPVPPPRSYARGHPARRGRRVRLLQGGRRRCAPRSRHRHQGPAKRSRPAQARGPCAGSVDSGAATDPHGASQLGGHRGLPVCAG